MRRAHEKAGHGPRSRRGITQGKLDLGPWNRFSTANSTAPRKRVLVKIIGN